MRLLNYTLLFIFTMLSGYFAPAMAKTNAEDALYERAAVLAADARCKLFDAKTRAALEAAMSQARSAMIRGGAPAKAVDSVVNFATKAGSRWDCNSPDMQVIAGRVKSAFSAYNKYNEMHFPGDQQKWVAQKYTAERVARWRVVQRTNTHFANYAFGTAVQNNRKALMLVVANPKARPASIVLMMRDFRKAPRPVGAGFLESVTFRSTSTSTALRDRVPPYASSRPFFPSGKTRAEASLTKPESNNATAYIFPEAVIKHLERLDPREAIEVRLTIPAHGNRPEYIERAYFEVGDFVAARAFIRAGS